MSKRFKEAESHSPLSNVRHKDEVINPSELLTEIDEAVGTHDEAMDIYERWERSAPERQG